MVECVSVCQMSLTGAIDRADDAYSSGTPGHNTNDTTQLAEFVDLVQRSILTNNE